MITLYRLKQNNNYFMWVPAHGSSGRPNDVDEMVKESLKMNEPILNISLSRPEGKYLILEEACNRKWQTYRDSSNRSALSHGSKEHKEK